MNLENIGIVFVMLSYLLVNVSLDTNLGQWLSNTGETVVAKMNPVDPGDLIGNYGIKVHWDHKKILQQKDIVVIHFIGLESQNGKNLTKNFVLVFSTSSGNSLIKETNRNISHIRGKIEETLREEETDFERIFERISENL